MTVDPRVARAAAALQLPAEVLDGWTDAIAGRAAHVSVPSSEPDRYLTKLELAEHLGCGRRSIEYAMQQGLPHSIIFGKAKFKLSEAEPWLEAHGYIERRLDEGCDNGPSASGAAPLTRPAPDTERGAFDASQD